MPNESAHTIEKRILVAYVPKMHSCKPTKDKTAPIIHSSRRDYSYSEIYSKNLSIKLS